MQIPGQRHGKTESGTQKGELAEHKSSKLKRYLCLGGKLIPSYKMFRNWEVLGVYNSFHKFSTWQVDFH